MLIGSISDIMVYPRKTITIRRDQAEWLEEHPEFSLSGLTQKSIDEEIRRYEQSHKKDEETPQTAEIQGVSS